ncbi:MAG: DUF3325 domain-containing protein [Comamonas sp.]
MTPQAGYALAASLLAALCAWSALALAMDRHFEDCYGRGAERKTRPALLQCAGWSGLIVSLAAAWLSRGPVVGSVLWFGILTFSGVAVVAVGALRPRRLRQVPLGAGLLAIVLGMWLAGTA